MKKKRTTILIIAVIAVVVTFSAFVYLHISKSDTVKESVTVEKEGTLYTVKVSDNKDNQPFHFKEEFVLKDQKEIEKIMKQYNISSDSSITEVIYSPLINMAEEENQVSEKSSEILTETVSVQEICELYFSSWYMAPSGARNIEEIFEAKIDVKSDKNVINAVKNHYNLESFQFASSIKTQEVQVKEGCKKNMMGYLYQENSSFTVTDDGKEICQGTICIPKGLILLVSEDIPTL